jgi:hypothetical protein
MLSCCAVLQPSSTPAFLDKDWQGTWEGTLNLHGSTENGTSIPMEMHIAPREGGRFTWHIVRGPAEKKQRLNYELVPDAARRDLCQIDEKNGIELQGRKLGNTIYLAYRVGNNWYDTRYTLTGDKLLFELTVSDIGKGKEQAKDGKNLGVTAHAVIAVQRAELSRRAEKK